MWKRIKANTFDFSQQTFNSNFLRFESFYCAFKMPKDPFEVAFSGDSLDFNEGLSGEGQLVRMLRVNHHQNWVFTVVFEDLVNFNVVRLSLGSVPAWIKVQNLASFPWHLFSGTCWTWFHGKCGRETKPRSLLGPLRTEPHSSLSRPNTPCLTLPTKLRSLSCYGSSDTRDCSGPPLTTTRSGALLLILSFY